MFSQRRPDVKIHNKNFYYYKFHFPKFRGSYDQYFPFLDILHSLVNQSEEIIQKSTIYNFRVKRLQRVFLNLFRIVMFLFLYDEISKCSQNFQ